VETIGTAIWVLIIWLPHRKALKNPMTSKNKFPGWIVLRVLPAKSVLLYSDIILTVLETLVFSIQYYHAYAYPSFWA
jgi:hypothetical protein